MTISSEIVTRLRDDSGVGAIAGDRIHRNRLPQSPTLPAVVYQYIPTVGPLYNLSGESGLEFARLQITSWAENESEAMGLDAAIKSSLSGFNGTLVTLFAEIKVVSSLHDIDSEDTDDKGMARDYFITYR